MGVWNMDMILVDHGHSAYCVHQHTCTARDVLVRFFAIAKESVQYCTALYSTVWYILCTVKVVRSNTVYCVVRRYIEAIVGAGLTSRAGFAFSRESDMPTYSNVQ